MKVLVTGGSGFLGSHVADALTKRNHDVVSFDLKPSEYRQGNQKNIVGSILDMEAFGNAMKGSDAVYHLAAIADIGDAVAWPLKTVEVNILGTANALELARINNVKRFVYSSSIYVYSDHGSFYRTSKRAAELLIEDYQNNYGLSYSILRFGSLYGPRADYHNSVFRLLNQALTEGRIDYPGTGDEVREYIHVFDAASAAADILDDEFENERISLTGHERMKSSEMLGMVNEMMGRKLTIKYRKETDEGHYIETPYSYNPRLGKKLTHKKYIDLGLGLLDCLQNIDQKLNSGNDPS